MTRGALGLTLLALAGCIRFDYIRTRVDEPIDAERIDALQPGATLAECLESLGAPTYVWDDPRGIWLAYIWIDEKGPRISASIPTSFLDAGGAGPSPSISYNRVMRKGEGVTLCFDEDLNLRFARRGLTDLPEDAVEP